VTFPLVILVVAVALAFDYTNGFHDAANAIATSVSTGALTPRVALLMAAVFNLVGALLGEGVAKTIGSGIISIPTGGTGSSSCSRGSWAHRVEPADLVARPAVVVLARADRRADRRRRGLDRDGALGGDLGQGRDPDDRLAAGRVPARVPADARHPLGVPERRAGPINRRFRHAQTVLGGAMALGHGLQDAQKTMGVIVIALVAGGYHSAPTSRCG
jgi:PiT family inorganic phosphate transporter